MLHEQAAVLLMNVIVRDEISTSNLPSQPAPGTSTPLLMQPQNYSGTPNFGNPQHFYRGFGPPCYFGWSSRVMYLGCGCARGHGYCNAPDFYSNSSRIFTSGGASKNGTSIQDALEQLNGLQSQQDNRKTNGQQHTCYKPMCGMSYPAGYGDICPKCGTNQELHEAGLLKWVKSKKLTI